MTGNAESEVNVSCRIVVTTVAPLVRVRGTAKLPETAGVPEIRPVTESIVSPAGNPSAVTRAELLVPLVNTWNTNGTPVRPVAAVLLARVGPVGGPWIVRVKVAVVVTLPLVALKFTWKVPGAFGVPVI